MKARLQKDQRMGTAKWFTPTAMSSKDRTGITNAQALASADLARLALFSKVSSDRIRYLAMEFCSHYQTK